MSVLTIVARDIIALIKAAKLGEEIKPSQQAKRQVFDEEGIAGTYKDRILTAIFYDIWKRVGIIDRIASEVTGVKDIAILDPWLRASLRVSIELLVFERFIKDRDKIAKQTYIKYLKGPVAAFLSNATHPYVGMYFWEVIDKIINYSYNPKDLILRWEYKYMVSEFIIRKLVDLIGKEETKRFLQSINKIPPINVRVNTLKSTIEEVVSEFEKEGVRPTIGKYVPTIIKFKGPYDFNNSKLFNEGKIVIQEEASAVASLLLNPKPGEIVVDLCAAPGGKTMHIAELMRNQGIIYAFDVDEKRLRRMKKLLNRAGVTIAKIHHMDGRKAPKLLGEEIADKILVDAPCSSTGTLAKNHELRWRVRYEKVEDIQTLQIELLDTAVRLIKPGGRILYTVCSVFKEEGEDVVKYILDKHQGALTLVPIDKPFDPGFLRGTMRSWPHRHGVNGFFYALLEKTKILR
ncbi:MAG: RsmB/NOP family class I SAM-dependent RNA methyltransferase [Ignisphaera sp.]|uniref:RsmB/NOP family class I SAM-dependent RNA methyltransferase n=1 Tax=Ignisphaera aggregans TaxID=334771 RepID=A0A7C4NMR9_9CREN